VLTLPLAGGAGSRRHRELALGLLRGGRPRTRRATRCLGGRVPCLERHQFAFERRDTSRSLVSEAPHLRERGLAFLDQPIHRVGEVNGGNLAKLSRSRHSKPPLERQYQDTHSRATFAVATAQPSPPTETCSHTRLNPGVCRIPRPPATAPAPRQ